MILNEFELIFKWFLQDKSQFGKDKYFDLTREFWQSNGYVLCVFVLNKVEGIKWIIYDDEPCSACIQSLITRSSEAVYDESILLFSIDIWYCIDEIWWECSTQQQKRHE